MSTDNTTSILHIALQKSGVKATIFELEDLLHSHPQYPSLVCISDTLNQLGVKHHIIRLEKDELSLINKPFIAHLSTGGGQLVLVEQVENSQVTLLLSPGNRKRMALHQLANLFSGVVIIIESNQPKAKQGKGYSWKYEMIRVLPMALVLLGFLVLMGHLFVSHTGLDYPTGALGYLLPITKLLGLCLTIILVLHELSIPLSLTERICHLNPKTDCNAVLQSKAGKVLGPIGLADAGLIYFVATLMLLMARQLNLLAILSTVALLAPIYTVWAQLKLRKWCPLCLSVQVVLLAEFVVLAQLLPDLTVTLPAAALGLTTLTVVAAIWVLYKLHHEAKQHYRQQRKAFLGLKRQPAVFATLMAHQLMGDVPLTRNGFYFGPPNAPVSLAAFMSLQCPHCAAEFVAMRKLLAESSQVGLKLIVAPPDSKEQLQVLNHLVAKYKQQGEEAALNLLEQWYANPAEVLKQQLTDSSTLDNQTLNEWITSSRTLFEQFRVTGTPHVLVNGFKLPQTYSPYDLRHYIPEILLLTQRRKGQEAPPVAHP
ncbi:MAG: thioredoxin domain-containing protein [Bacteroidales bacterium]|nr:thioredoxin domain-containing protein [Bacteroidales bacterium]